MNAPKQRPEFLTAKQAAELLSTRPYRLLRLAAANQIPWLRGQ